MSADNTSLLLSSLEVAARAHPGTVAAVGWVAGILSYHQDAKYRLKEWAMVSQVLSLVCLIALLAFAFTRNEWWNFLIVPALGWLQIECSRRWWARPGMWW